MEDNSIKKLGIDFFKHDFKYTLLRILIILVLWTLLYDKFLSDDLIGIRIICLIFYVVVEIVLLGYYSYKKHGLLKTIALIAALVITILLIFSTIFILVFLSFIESHPNFH